MLSIAKLVTFGVIRGVMIRNVIFNAWRDLINHQNVRNDMENYSQPIKLPIPKFTFMADEGIWLLEITNEGIKFNREYYPNAMPDNFAQAFIDILEMNYDVHFTKRKIKE